MRKHEIDYSRPEVFKRIVEALIANTPAAFVILDREFRMQYVNDHFLALRKTRREDVIGCRCYDLINEGRFCHHCAVKKAIETNSVQKITRKDILPDGTARFVDEYAVPLVDENGRYDYILEIMQNRTNEMILRESIDRMVADTIGALIAVMDKKDAYTSTHSRDVAEIGCKLGRIAGLANDELHELRLAGLLHDIGKIYIADGIINKKDRLNDGEFREIRRHPIETMSILKPFPRFAAISHIAGHHHERWDGDGYPNGLQGEAIPLGARILAIADAYDAMTSERSYRKAVRHEVAVREIYRNAGKQFDPNLADLFMELSTRMFPSRKSLTTVDVAPSPAPKSQSQRADIVRRLTRVLHNPSRVVDKKVSTVFLNKRLTQAIVDHSPGHYLIVDDGFNILFASRNVAEDFGFPSEQLLAMRCFERSDKQMSCFRTGDGEIACPVIRAFASGEQENGIVLEEFKGKKHPCEIVAVPLELIDTSGRNFPCVMEIIVDRSRETRERDTLKSDATALLELLYGLVSNIDSETTRAGDEIAEECESFVDYLKGMQEKMRLLTGTRSRRRETAQLS